MTNKKDSFGYDLIDEVDVGGRYLAFRKGDKGRVIHVRLASRPKYVNQHWITDSEGKDTPVNCKGKNCPYCGEEVPVKERVRKTPKFGWIVIDRMDDRPKVFTGAFSIARDIKTLAEDDDWGNPLLYDIKVTRTEEPGNYYKVVPVPTGKGKPLTKDEKSAIKEMDFDLEAELQGGQESRNIGNYEGANESEEKEVFDEKDLPF